MCKSTPSFREATKTGKRLQRSLTVAALFLVSRLAQPIILVPTFVRLCVGIVVEVDALLNLGLAKAMAELIVVLPLASFSIAHSGTRHGDGWQCANKCRGIAVAPNPDLALELEVWTHIERSLLHSTLLLLSSIPLALFVRIVLAI